MKRAIYFGDLNVSNYKGNAIYSDHLKCWIFSPDGSNDKIYTNEMELSFI